MVQALYRGWRPKTFSEVVGQEHITKTLSRAIKDGRVSHAYLFTGPRGVGKTSIARILAHEVNSLPYNDESIHLDIIEIDAASNRRIDEIRELRDKVHISPTSARYKVYIIDEVHMLTREAFNALLKTLEEPPAHCIFILATTEAHKLPETIVSRTQRFEFKPIGAKDAAQHLGEIAKKEKISIAPQALELLAEHGEGSFRDSINLLDQLHGMGEKISEQSVRDFLGLPSAETIKNLIEAVEAGQIGRALEHLDNLRIQGADAATTSRILAKELRQKLIQNQVPNWLPELLKELIEIPASSRPDDSLELAVLRACASNITTAPSSDPSEKQAAIPKEIIIKQAPRPAEKSEAVSEPLRVVPTDSAVIDEQSWEAIIEKVKDQAASLYTALRLASPQVDNGKLTLSFQFPLHQKKVNQARHKELIGRVVAEVTGQELAVDSVVDKSKAPAERPSKTKAAPKPADDKQLKSISNIFGKAEVLES